MHSLVFVVVPFTVTDREAAVACALRGAARTYETFELPCSCVGAIAFADAWRRVDGGADGQQWLRDVQLAREQADTHGEREALRRRYKCFLSLYDAHPLCERAAADCEVCQGRGVNAHSRNPADHHDWWTIGGRWDGLLHSQLGPNVVRIEDVPAEVCPAAVVTAEGDWHQGPAGLPYNAESREPADLPERELAKFGAWKKTVAALSDRYHGHVVVVVDCHS